MAINAQLDTIQFKRGTAAALSLANPLLLKGEPCFEEDTNKFKIGDGVSSWNSLDYIAGGTSISTEDIQDTIDSTIVDGTGITAVYDDNAGTYTITLDAAYIAKLDFLTVTSAVDLDTLASNVTTNNAKVSASGSIASHSNFSITGIVDGQIPRWNASNGQFEPSNDQTSGGGGGATQLSELSDVNGSIAFANKNVIIGDGTEFIGRQLIGTDISDLQTTINNNASVVANTAKRTYPSADETKLAGIESGAKDDQDAIDVPYIANGQNNVQGALNDLYTNKADDSAVLKTGTTEERRINNSRLLKTILITGDRNIASTDVEFTSNPDEGKKPVLRNTSSSTYTLSIPNGFGNDDDTFIVQNDGDGIVRVVPEDEETLSIIGPNFGINHNSVEISGLQRAVFMRRAVNDWRVDGTYSSFFYGADAANDPSLVADFNADNLVQTAGQTVSSWPSNIGGFQFNTVGSDPVVQVRADLRKEVTFDGATQAMAMPSNYAELNFNPSTDNFTFIVVMGEDAISGNHVLNKGTSGGVAATHFGIDLNATPPNGNIVAGGVNSTVPNLRNDIVDSVVVFRGTAGAIELIVNDVLVDTLTAGTYTNTYAWCLASRFAGTSQLTAISYRRILFYDSALSDSKLTSIYTQENA